MASSGGGASLAIDHDGPHDSTVSASAASSGTALPARQRKPVAIKPPPRRPPPTAAKTPHQLALEQLQRIRKQTLAAFLNAQWIAASGAPSGRQTANSTIQSALGSAQPRIERILASMGLSLPSRATTPSSWRSSPTMTNVGDPARSAGSTR